MNYKKYNFKEENEAKWYHYVIYLVVIALIVIAFTACSKYDNPAIYYNDLECSCPNPVLDIKNETCVCT